MEALHSSSTDKPTMKARNGYSPGGMTFQLLEALVGKSRVELLGERLKLSSPVRF